MVNAAAVGPYFGYWSSYETARAINQIGAKFGLPGSIISHTVALPLAIPEATGLGTDIAIDWVKNTVFGDREALNDEGNLGAIIESPFRDLIPGGGPKTYLPGWRKDGGLDFEW